MYVPSLAFYWQLIAISYGLIDIVNTKDKSYAAATWSAYIAGMEVFIRMTGETVFWELGKYVITLFLIMGLIVSGRPVRMTYILYFLLLLPSILIGNYRDFAQAKEMISFNLSGPLCLAASAIYFYHLRLSGADLLKLIRALVLPVVGMIMYILIQTPEISSITFTSNSNFVSSGGYGPNQVSLLIGVGIFFIIVLRYYQVSFSGIRWLDYILVGVFTYRALITFSRGGVLGTVLAIAVFILTGLVVGTNKRFFNLVLTSIVITALGFFIWNYTNEATEGALEYRYEGISIRTGQQKDYSSGRLLIIRRDLNTFMNNPFLGVGPGIGKLQEFEILHWAIPAHTEWTRMLAEHGLFGLLALLILAFAPPAIIYSNPQGARPFLYAVFILSLFSMFHAAIRLSIIGFLYGLALIRPVNGKNSIHRK